MNNHHLPEANEHGFYYSEDRQGGSWSVYGEEYPGHDREAPPIDGSQRLVRRGLSSRDDASALADSLYRSNNRVLTIETEV